MFGETEKLKAGVFDRKLEESGAETNAATWVDWTYYHELLPADRVRLAVQLEAERMQHLVLREPQVASEKEVVANERRYRVDDDVEGVANELLYKTAFTTPPVPLADHRLDGGHQGLHARGLRGLLPDVLRAEQRDGRRRRRRARARAPALRSATRTAPSRASRSRPRT